jgi:hypothetical protein
MAFAKITGGGLSAIAMLVIVLWACIIGEHLIVARANRELARTMLEVRKLQNRKNADPVSAPAPAIRTRLRPAIG